MVSQKFGGLQDGASMQDWSRNCDWNEISQMLTMEHAFVILIYLPGF